MEVKKHPPQKKPQDPGAGLPRTPSSWLGVIPATIMKIEPANPTAPPFVEPLHQSRPGAEIRKLHAWLDLGLSSAQASKGRQTGRQQA